MKITARAFNRTVSVDTCRLMWKNLLHPTINKGKWTKQEDRKRGRQTFEKAKRVEHGGGRTAKEMCALCFAKRSRKLKNKKN